MILVPRKLPGGRGCRDSPLGGFTFAAPHAGAEVVNVQESAIIDVCAHGKRRGRCSHLQGNVEAQKVASVWLARQAEKGIWLGETMGRT